MLNAFSHIAGPLKSKPLSNFNCFQISLNYGASNKNGSASTVLSALIKGWQELIINAVKKWAPGEVLAFVAGLTEV